MPKRAVVYVARLRAEGVPLPPSAGQVRRALFAALHLEGVGACEVAVTFVSDARIRALNRRYRGKDQPTDVLSFPLEEGEPMPWVADRPRPLGDIVVSLPRAQTQAAEYGHPLAREVAYLCVHGLLHLLGYDHEDEPARERMRTKEEAALAVVGLRR